MFNHLTTGELFTPEQVLENRGRVAIFIDGSRWKGMLYRDSKVPKTIGDVTLIR